jgi:predicted TIM-barrel fold metal-dependent hydrolase
MNLKIKLTFIAIILWGASYSQDAESLLLKNYRPVSIYNIPVTEVNQARFPVIDMHSHDYTATDEQIQLWIKNMDAFGIEKTVILSMATGEKFDSIYDKYASYCDRFEVWCGFDYTGYNEKDWPSHALIELERCYKKGARGVGELGDKGLGLVYSKPTPAYGMHIDDPRMKPLLERCGELGMPINIHVAEPYWMYLPADSTNDGLMNASTWKIDLTKEGILNHGQLITTLENAVRDNPNTVFIACHFANCCFNLEILGSLLDRYANLYADISARYAETATIPRYMASFYKKYQDRLLYGTDMGYDGSMYETTFRILQTADEHFYRTEQFNYHWALNGFDLDNEILQKVYKANAERVSHLPVNPKKNNK